MRFLNILSTASKITNENKNYTTKLSFVYDFFLAGESDPQPLFQQMRQSKTTLDQDDCYESSVNAYLEICTKYQDYSYFMKDVYVFKNLCTQGKSPAAIRDAVVAVCGEK